MSKTANIDEIEEHSRRSIYKDKEKSEFDNEIMSIIGNINMKALFIKNKMGT
jgi:hypothetical protein